ncbi:MAG: hypothetical protein Q7K48_08175 [Fusobacterium sp. JB021]|nr:hypothetical protein [Fusobacterium sp. JB020]MDP0494261.1 hypothetical protein [Fusobacterium sp. JB021]MDP0505746.1 hypothetical protein [Fusobacterium sp. JB019]
MLVPFPKNLIKKVEIKNGEIVFKKNISQNEKKEFFKTMKENLKKPKRYDKNGNLLTYDI